jgi:hypothetical protein
MTRSIHFVQHRRSWRVFGLVSLLLLSIWPVWTAHEKMFDRTASLIGHARRIDKTTVDYRTIPIEDRRMCSFDLFETNLNRLTTTKWSGANRIRTVFCLLHYDVSHTANSQFSTSSRIGNRRSLWCFRFWFCFSFFHAFDFCFVVFVRNEHNSSFVARSSVTFSTW